MNNLSKILYGIASTNLRIGEMRAFSGSTPPAGWKLCDGTPINRVLYSNLFSIIGTTYGGGDGETTFALPDTKGRTIVSPGESSATGHTAHTLGQMDGEEKHVVLLAELASHNHAYNGHGRQDNASGRGCQPLSAYYYPNDGWSGQWSKGQGSNSQHNTMQPFATCNYIIYTGVLE